MAISKRTRFEVLRRDNHTCRYCGAKAPDVELQVDHVIPKAIGGSDQPDNLATACLDCNSGKASTTPDAPHVDDVKEAHLKWRTAYRQAVQEASEEAQEVLQRQMMVEKTFTPVWDEWRATNGSAIPLPATWVSTCDGFLKAGLSPKAIFEAIDIACGNNRIADRAVFKYFCGICHNKLRAIADRAAEIMGDTE
ncbi:HNH endonuclease [Micrococcus luteus]|nr:HNH endonuclease [Micrococcus luteus]